MSNNKDWFDEHVVIDTSHIKNKKEANKFKIDIKDKTREIFTLKKQIPSTSSEVRYFRKITYKRKVKIGREGKIGDIWIDNSNDLSYSLLSISLTSSDTIEEYWCLTERINDFLELIKKKAKEKSNVS